MKEKINYKNFKNSILKLVWINSFAFIIGIILYISLGSINLLKWFLLFCDFNNPKFIIFIIFIALSVFLLIFCVQPYKQLRRQKIRKQPSWVFYVYFGLASSLVYWYLLSVYQGDIKFAWLHLFYSSIILIVCVVINLFIRPLKGLNDYRRFAPDSAGIKNDEMGFKNSAKNVSLAFNDLKDPINVVGLYGDLGFGKSSYVRMIIESLDKEEVLYSYISLTETNEAKDFSSLFAERWFETLNSRYPKINTDNGVTLLKTILRESNNGWISEIIYFISKFSRGLIKTKVKIFDKNLGYKPSFASVKVAKIFGNIPLFSEKFWIIVIDEIDRALLAEIYRVIEVIERFKMEGRSGVPIKIIFVLCLAREELKEILDDLEDKNCNDVVKQIKSFFFKSGNKSVTLPIFLPPVSNEKKQNYIVKRIRDIKDRVASNDGLSNLNPETPLNFIDPIKSFLGDHRKSYDFIFYMLMDESPRVVQRTLADLRNFFNTFAPVNNDKKENQIRFSDLLSLSYIKVKYPFLIDFFSKTINQFREKSVVDQMSEHLLLPSSGDKKNKNVGDLLEQIHSVTEHEVNKKDKINVLNMVALVAYPYIERLNHDFDYKNKINYVGTSSLSENLNDYLKHVMNETNTFFKSYHQIYISHKKDIEYVEDINIVDLLNYSKFVRKDVANVDSGIHSSIAYEMYTRIVRGKIKIEPKKIGETLYDSAVYEFIFHLLEMILTGYANDENILHAKSLFVNILYNKQVSTGAKFMILNSFANNNRGSDSLIHRDFEEAFEKMSSKNKKEVKDAISHVFLEADERYFKGGDVIYEKESNFFYVMYQYWSGNKAKSSEIDKIRDVARRGLGKHHDAVVLYWNRFPLNDMNKDEEQFLNDILDSDHSFINRNSTLYMPLGFLISITKELKVDDYEVGQKLSVWGRLISTIRYRKFEKINNDSNTLKAVLMSRGFLNE